MRLFRLLILPLAIFISALLFLALQKANIIDIIKDGGIASATKAVRTEPDIELQKPLSNPPAVIKAIYATSWSAASENKLAYLVNLIKKTELNAVVIDMKDYSGYVVYNTELELPKKYNAVETRIPRLNALIKKLHDENIYVIARIAVFQDQRLPLARPELALTSSSTGAVWKDYKGLMWLDTASQAVWDYNVAIARELLDRGVDEANFDYIRFASDGDLNDIKYPFWDEKKLKVNVLRDFFKYLRDQLWDKTISADLFGLVTVNTDGLGIGQHLEYALPYFDFIAPMVYPSHYFKGFIGYEKPAEFPYEVVKYSLERAARRIETMTMTMTNDAESSSSGVSHNPLAKLRPWFQDFNLGANYDAEKVLAQIRAWNEITANNPELDGGWMLWNPSNVYTKEALKNE